MVRTLCCLFAVLCMLTACKTWNKTTRYMKDSWETTRSYIDPNPTIDTKAYEQTNPNQVKLAKLFTPVDGPLTSLVNFLEDQDAKPDEKWFDMLFVRFPWVNRAFYTDKDGKILKQRPSVPMKRFSRPLEFKAVWRDTFLKTVADYPELGPELYIGTPFFEDVHFRGLIVAGFDPRTLIKLSPEPKELMIIHPGGGVWSVNDKLNTKAILALKWKEMLEDSVTGRFTVDGKIYTWLARYIGSDCYVYATECADPKVKESSWWWPF